MEKHSAAFEKGLLNRNTWTNCKENDGINCCLSFKSKLIIYISIVLCKVNVKRDLYSVGIYSRQIVYFICILAVFSISIVFSIHKYVNRKVCINGYEKSRSRQTVGPVSAPSFVLTAL